MRDGNWHHVAMVLNKEHGLRLFLNGKNVASTNIVENNNIDYPTFSPTVNVLDLQG